MYYVTTKCYILCSDLNPSFNALFIHDISFHEPVLHLQVAYITCISSRVNEVSLNKLLGYPEKLMWGVFCRINFMTPRAFPRVHSPFSILYLATAVRDYFVTKLRDTPVRTASCYPSSHAIHRPEQHGLSSDARNRYIVPIEMLEISSSRLTRSLLDTSEAAAGYATTRISPERFAGQKPHDDG